MPQEQQPLEVTVVTRNDNTAATLPTLIELAATAFAFYYITHPDIFERVRGFIDRQLDRIIHRLSVWQMVNSIRGLPETHQ